MKKPALLTALLFYCLQIFAQQTNEKEMLYSGLRNNSNPSANKILACPPATPPATPILPLMSQFTKPTMATNMDIYDVGGRILKEIKITGNSSNKIDLNDLGTGMYILRIYDGEHVQNIKLIKN